MTPQKTQFRLSEPRFFEEMPMDFYKDAKREWAAFMEKIQDKLIVKRFLEKGE